jgi:hypothetical protein
MPRLRFGSRSATFTRRADRQDESEDSVIFRARAHARGVPPGAFQPFMA